LSRAGPEHEDHGKTVSVATAVPPLLLAEISDVVVMATSWLVTVKVKEVAPVATVTKVGTVAAAVLLLMRLTLLCEVVPAAGPFSVTVAVEFATPPTTLVGRRLRETTWAGLIVSVAVWETPLRMPVMVTLVTAPTALVVTLKVAVVAPAGTVTLAGVTAEKLLSDRVTAAPPAGATPFKVTVPVEEVPPITLSGLMLTAKSAGGLMVSAAVLVTPL
jgi:hypothetical protein